jgi:hypothetical protein
MTLHLFVAWTLGIWFIGCLVGYYTHSEDPE